MAAVLLEWEERDDALYTLGIVGRPVFHEFFESFPAKGLREVEGITSVWDLERYSATVIPC